MANDLRTRLLVWEGCLNARDLGGYPTSDGQTTRWGAVVRSDYPGWLTDAGRTALINYGVRTIVDLRLPDELVEYPNPFAAPASHGIDYVHQSFIDPSAVPLQDLASLPLVEEYVRILDRFHDRVALITQMIARAREGTVLVHCAAGKDRTGLICALLLELAGVSRELVATDYALSAECLGPRTQEWLWNGPGERAEREREFARTNPRAEIMLEVLDELEDRYGGVEAYLIVGGMTPDDITHLRERIVNPTS